MKFYENIQEKIIETKIKPNLKTIYEMRIKGLTDKQIAKYIGVSVRNFLDILETTDVLEEVYQEATRLLCAKLREVVIGRALGTDGKLGKKGELLGPDVGLAFKMLEKLDPEYRERKEMDLNIVSVEEVIKEIGRRRQGEIKGKVKELVS